MAEHNLQQNITTVHKTHPKEGGARFTLFLHLFLGIVQIRIVHTRRAGNQDVDTARSIGYLDERAVGRVGSVTSQLANISKQNGRVKVSCSSNRSHNKKDNG